MDELERNLRESLRRRDPPPGFAERVLARAGASGSRKTAQSGWSGWGWSWRWVAVAAMVVAMIGGFAFYRQERQRAADERAKQELMYALRLTGSQVRYLQERLEKVQQRRIELPMAQE